jgi:F0F1-type ATP synthase gamma subunit
MKMVSAAKLKKAQDDHNALMPKINGIIAKSFYNLEGDAGGIYHNVILKVLLVVVTSNRGLAGVLIQMRKKTVLSFMQENK